MPTGCPVYASSTYTGEHTVVSIVRYPKVVRNHSLSVSSGRQFNPVGASGIRLHTRTLVQGHSPGKEESQNECSIVVVPVATVSVYFTITKMSPFYRLLFQNGTSSSAEVSPIPKPEM